VIGLQQQLCLVTVMHVVAWHKPMARQITAGVFQDEVDAATDSGF
jgi:hypothetical protein